ncbi:phage antirepressor N-terminal domain-containing protein [Comamonas sp. NyZ500]|uniref:phage antirepressor N-terminal domain-containing protein n=1 Tax=Comamonas sp. NyZ500 TaxID=2795732 RepID=UPI00192AC748|nr:phage antirepressor N-terminal domain-containing protein [Comamonas sp. NyZ500]MBL5979723.1 phage antirepressor N-terminal domain-containing protein [Comamonas sp. NyZ500]
MKSRPEKGNAPEVAATEASNVQTQPLTEGFNMLDSTEINVNRAITVPFHGAELYVVEHNGQPYTPMKPIVLAMGLDWGSQFRKVATNESRWGIVNLTIPSAGGDQAMTCLPIRKTAAWLTTIEPGKVKSPEVRARVIRYQNECDDVLWSYWNEGIAINPRQAFAVNPGDSLTAEEAETLRLMLKSAVERQPKAKQGALMMQGWSKLKAHFKVGYREIPRHEFSEAVSIIARHTADWEVVDERVDQLPRLKLRVSPPAIGMYRYNPANPHPANGRTIEVAKSIATDIRNWSDNLPAGPARYDLHDAAQTLHDLLVSGWTEVDEALGQLQTAVHYLNRWQGSGGRIGNAR